MEETHLCSSNDDGKSVSRYGMDEMYIGSCNDDGLQREKIRNG